jgi:galactokinase/mevalonate kinase-like predicted kinase
MIISGRPYRVSFAGGGTDLTAFYRREGGAVLSAAIDRTLHVRPRGLPFRIDRRGSRNIFLQD